MQAMHGAVIGLVSGIIVGIATLISDIVFYSRHPEGLRTARKYSNSLIQLGIFLGISLFYGAIQGVVFSWLIPILPANIYFRGLIFGFISFLILSRHFAEGIAVFDPEFFPTLLSIYLTFEFLMIYVLQGILISIGMLLFG